MCEGQSCCLCEPTNYRWIPSTYLFNLMGQYYPNRNTPYRAKLTIWYLENSHMARSKKSNSTVRNPAKTVVVKPHQRASGYTKKLKINPSMSKPVIVPESKSLGFSIKNKSTLMITIKDGFPVGSFDTLRKHLSITQERMRELVDLTNTTLARRKEAGKLSKLESDRVYRYAHLFELAKIMMLGDEAEASTWLKIPKDVLDNQSPLDYAITEAGARDVERYINRIMDGTYT